MKRGETRYNAEKQRQRPKADKFDKVFDDKGQRVRGLWLRKGVYYAQLDANNGKQYKYRLEHAGTVPQALTEAQVLKKTRREGKLYPPGVTEEEVKNQGGSNDHTVKEAIETYQSERKTLQKKDPATCTREDSGLKKWVLGFGDRLLRAVDAKIYKDYAIFCKESAEKKVSSKKFHGEDFRDLPALASSLVEKSDPVSAWLWERLDKESQESLASVQKSEEGGRGARIAFAKRLNEICQGESIYDETRFDGVRLRAETRYLLGKSLSGKPSPQLNRLLLEDKFSSSIMRPHVQGSCSGRNIDLGIIAMNHVLDWAIVERWLPEDFRKPSWEPMAEDPSEDRLMEPAEIDKLCKAALLDREALKLLDPRVRHLRAAQSVTGQNFHDYLRLLQWAGGREQETLRQRWTNVHWSKNGARGYLHFPGEEAKAGGGEPAEPRDVMFSNQLEAHLKKMFKRRDPDSDWMFPSARHDGPISSFRKQLERIRKQTGIEDVTFQYFRHWFISHCVMANIDYKTIAYWVSHRDGGVLIGRLYGHLDKEHPAKMAKKLSIHFS